MNGERGSRLDGLHNDTYYTESFRGGSKKFELIGGEVQDVFAQALQDVFIDLHGKEEGTKKLKIGHWFVERDLSSVNTIGTLLREENTQKAVGFIYAFPEPDVLKEASVGWAAIVKEHRREGGLVLMINNLATGLISKGYEYINTSLRADYYPGIKEKYKENIVYERSFDNPDFLGKQVHFKASLK